MIRMKILGYILFGFILLGNVFTIHAQLTFTIPEYKIFERIEGNADATIMYSTERRKWRKNMNPSLWVVGSENFTHTSLPNLTLPTNILLWQLHSIGGIDPLFHHHDYMPGFQFFTSAPQAWYYPSKGRHPEGNIVFTFNMPSSAFANNKFVAGEYAIYIDQNYPEFYLTTTSIVLNVPKAITWFSGLNNSYTLLNSLNSYRYAPSQVGTNFGDYTIASTVDFKFFAKSASSTIQFTSTSGEQSTRNIGLIKLTSDNPKIATLPLTANWQDFTPSNNFNVEVGNRNTFEISSLISNSDFKTHFYEAGDYIFTINLGVLSTDGSIYDIHNLTYSLRVEPLSEIIVPPSGNTVNFTFNTAEHYQNGQSQTVFNQLRISNNETYELNVKTDSPYFKIGGIQSNVPAAILEVGVEGGLPPVTLSTTSQKIISNGTPVLDKNLNITYRISPRAARSLVSKERDTYSINVIYSFTAL